MAKDYKPNKKPLIGDVTMNDKTIKVSHPDDHPDVERVTKRIKKNRKEFKEDSPKSYKFADIMGLMDDTPKEKAKKKLASAQGRLAKKRTETEGSFAKGGRAGYKGGKSVKKKGGCAIKGTSPILR